MPSDHAPPKGPLDPTALRRAEKLAWRRVLDETVVLDLASRTVFGLNEPGGRLVERLEIPRNRAELIRSAPDPEAAAAFLDQLLDLGLVEVCEEPEGPPHPEPPMSLSATPSILWSEPLPQLAQQGSPSMDPGDIQCFQ